mgnify:CR=1 FL=1
MMLFFLMSLITTKSLKDFSLKLILVKMSVEVDYNNPIHFQYVILKIKIKMNPKIVNGIPDFKKSFVVNEPVP